MSHHHHHGGGQSGGGAAGGGGTGAGGAPPSYWMYPGGVQQDHAQQQQHSEQQPFTAEMRDRQARGKDPYNTADAPESPGDWGRYRGGVGGSSTRDDTFTSADTRRSAGQVLDNPEFLMMISQQQDDSVPATRLRYTRMFTGLDDSQKKSSSSSSSSHGHHPRGGNQRSSERSGR